MSRITKKLYPPFDYNGKYATNGSDDNCIALGSIVAAYDKLGPLEDIEEALGIDLETLFYGIMKGIYIYDEDEDCIYSYVIDNIKYIKHGWGTCTPWGTYILFEDYGDTWALTREELENE